MLIVDCEASGLDPAANSLLSIGAVSLEAEPRIFYGECRIFDDASIMPATIAITGFSEQAMRDPAKKSPGQLLSEFIEWMRPCNDITLAGQNVYFDRDFLIATSKKSGVAFDFGYRILDLHTLCWTHMTRRGIEPPARERKSSLSLDGILGYCGVPPEPKPHLAINGAKLAAECFSRILYGKPALPDYSKYPLPDYLLK